LSEIKIKASSEKEEKLGAFMEKFGIKQKTQAIRTLIFISNTLKVIQIGNLEDK